MSIYEAVTGPATNTNPTGGIYYTDNALDPVPVFTRAIIADTSDQNLPPVTNVKLAIAEDPASGAIIVLAATSEFANTTTIDPNTGKPFQSFESCARLLMGWESSKPGCRKIFSILGST